MVGPLKGVRLACSYSTGLGEYRAVCEQRAGVPMRPVAPGVCSSGELCLHRDQVGSWKLWGPVFTFFCFFFSSSLGCSLCSAWSTGKSCCFCDNFVLSVGRSGDFCMIPSWYKFSHHLCPKRPLVGLVCTLKRVNSCYKTKKLFMSI